MLSPQTKHLNILTNSTITAILKSRLGPAQDLPSKAFQGNINCTPVTKPSGTRLTMLSYQLPAQDKRKFYTCMLSDQRHALLRSEKPSAILTCFPLFRPITVKRREQSFFPLEKSLEIIGFMFLFLQISYKSQLAKVSTNIFFEGLVCIGLSVGTRNSTGSKTDRA